LNFDILIFLNLILDWF